jgi:IclR family pca regulon transcriptional regulator
MSVGTRFPANASSSGKIILSDLSGAEFSQIYPADVSLPQVTPFTVKDMPKLMEQMDHGRRNGWIYTNQETALGMASLAVPIRVGGRVRYGLSTSATITYDGPTIVDKYLPDLLKAAKAMEGFFAARY